MTITKGLKFSGISTTAKISSLHVITIFLKFFHLNDTMISQNPKSQGVNVPQEGSGTLQLTLYVNQTQITRNKYTECQ